jgi:hypothetical protein
LPKRPLPSALSRSGGGVENDWLVIEHWFGYIYICILYYIGLYVYIYYIPNHMSNIQNVIIMWVKQCHKPIFMEI